MNEDEITTNKGKSKTVTFYLTPDALAALDRMEPASGCRSRSIMIDEMVKAVDELGGMDVLRRMRYATA